MTLLIKTLMNNLQHFFVFIKWSRYSQCCYEHSFVHSNSTQQRRELIWHLTELMLVTVVREWEIRIDIHLEWKIFSMKLASEKCTSITVRLREIIHEKCTWCLKHCFSHVTFAKKLKLMMMNAYNTCYCFLRFFLLSSETLKMLRIHIN